MTNYSYNILNKLILQSLILLPIILICKLSYNWLSVITSSLISIIICSIISIISYFMLIFTFDIVNINTMKNLLSKKRPTANN